MRLESILSPALQVAGSEGDFWKGWMERSAKVQNVRAVRETLFGGWGEQANLPTKERWKILCCSFFPWFENMQETITPHDKKKITK